MTSSPRHRIKRVPTSLALVCVALSGCARSLTEAQMFQPRPAPPLDAAAAASVAADYAFEPVEVTARDGTRDTPPRFARALYGASPLPETLKRLAIIDGAAHSDVLDREAAISAYRAFLAR